jgi:hypothetical protein
VPRTGDSSINDVIKILETWHAWRIVLVVLIFVLQHAREKLTWPPHHHRSMYGCSQILGNSAFQVRHLAVSSMVHLRCQISSNFALLRVTSAHMSAIVIVLDSSFSSSFILHRFAITITSITVTTITCLTFHAHNSKKKKQSKRYIQPEFPQKKIHIKTPDLRSRYPSIH